MRTNRAALTAVVVLGLSAMALAQDAKKAETNSVPDAKKLAPPVAIVGADIYTVTKGVIREGVVLIKDGKIIGVGKALAIPEGATRIDAKGKFVTPGFVTVSAANVGLRAAGGQIGRAHV